MYLKVENDLKEERGKAARERERAQAAIKQKQEELIRIEEQRQKEVRYIESHIALIWHLLALLDFVSDVRI